MANKLRGALRVLALVLLIVIGLPPVILVWALRLEFLRTRFTRWFYCAAGYIVGMRVTTHGSFSAERPLMIVSNHSSYLDVFVIGSQLPVSFTPKREVRRWPLIGFMCVLADCVFVERRPSEMQAASEEMEKRLAKGKVLCLFPEGTTSDGFNIKPFKSGFLRLVEMHAMPVQPVSIAYTHIGRDPVTAERRDEVAWIGESTTFFDHFWHVLTLPCIRVEIIVHPAIAPGAYPDRKALTQACEEVIVADVKKLLEHAHAR
jgi:1-acyl-sn-glycerol-3-phosphate acyltransferase